MPLWNKLLEHLDEAYKAGSKAWGALGNTFLESAERNPEYFKLGRAQPSSDLSVLSKRHGVELTPMELQDESSRVPSFGGLSALDPSTGAFAWMTPTDTPASYSKRAWELGEPGLAAEMGEFVRLGQMTPNTQMFTIDMTDAKPGAGAANRLYPALKEWLRAQPDAANVAGSGLSLNNMSRRSKHMAEDLERYGDWAGDRVRVHKDQLAPPGGRDREAEFHRLSTPEKSGVLNAILAYDTKRKADAALTYLRKQSQWYDDYKAKPLMPLARSLGVHEGVWTPSTDVGPEYFAELAELIRAASALTPRGTPQVGVDSLRRAAITHDVLTQGLTAADLKSQPYLTKGLARKSGGAIPAHTPGALTQTCGCAGSGS